MPYGSDKRREPDPRWAVYTTSSTSMEDDMKRAHLLSVVGAIGLSLAAASAVPAESARAKSAQSQASRDSIPKAYMPPAKMCRVWIDGVPPAQQPAPTDCPTAIQKKPANGRVIYGEDKGKESGPEKAPVKGLAKPPEK